MSITNVPKKSKHHGLLILFVIISIIALLILDSRYRLVATEYELSYSDLPSSFEGYRIVQLSDLHMKDFGEKLPELVAKQKPDIIVLTGDFLNMRTKDTEGSQTEKLRPILEGLAKIAPCYFVSGNHEWASREMNELADLLGELKIKYLRNEFVLLEKGDESIVLAGVEDPNGPADMMKPDKLTQIIAENYPDKYTLLLAHRNDWMTKYPNLPVDTILCGHAHGGIVRLPFAGGVVGTEMDFFPKYDAGVYNEGNYDMLMSRGLGGYSIPPRFLNNPEVVTVILKKS
ncbi:MAG: phosphoesterase [Firmicutes bacterium HGW-Firmicutes-16]|nr:MAG: phosphoesterase [Firmicutes bacterium HGW-Firmicutes-16]